MWEKVGINVISVPFSAFSSDNKLDNLVCIVDVNRLGQSQATQLAHDLGTYAARFTAFGWNTIVVDGHDVKQLLDAYVKAKFVLSFDFNSEFGFL